VGVIPDQTAAAQKRRRIRFMDDAEAFERATRGALPFRYLRWLTGCSDDDLRMLVCKIYTDAVLESSDGKETQLSSFARSLFHPAAYLLRKRHFYGRRPFVESQLETIDRPYFDRWFAKVYAALKGPKRIVARTSSGFDEFDRTDRIDSSVRLSTALKLFAAPLFIPWLLTRPPAPVRPRFLRAYRKALSYFAFYEGHFHRFPCRDFITFSDESNHPSRYLAFKRWCPGRMIVIQNGAREIHPIHAFGMLDLYLVFGPFAQRACADLRMKVRRTAIVGALCLDERHHVFLGAKDKDRLYDVVLVDQSVWPFNGVDPDAGAGLLKIVEHVGRYKERRPGCRIAYQMRRYFDPVEKAAVLSAVRARLPDSVPVLENEGKGDSYETIARSRLVLTFSSTLGIESFFLGAEKALFVNYSGSPCHDFAPEPRFQLTGDGSSYDAFEKKLDELLRESPEDIPDSVREHYAYFDGKTQERIAAAVAQEQQGLL
jgi:hypothetical protein